MDFDFSEEQQAISDLTRQIFEDKVTAGDTHSGEEDSGQLHILASLR